MPLFLWSLSRVWQDDAIKQLLTACKAALGGGGLFGVTYIDPAEAAVIVSATHSATVHDILSICYMACEI